MARWIAPRMWEGGECWIIGGGPSMPLQFGVPEDVIQGVYNKELPMSAYSPFLSPIHGKHVIGVNAAFLLGNWIDVVFFGDGGFYFGNKETLDACPKLKVSCNPNMRNKANVFDVKYMDRNGNHPMGMSKVPGYVSWNLNSGAAAINLAYHFGAKKIYLLGFDMQLGPAGNQHWHHHYVKGSFIKKNDPKALPFHRHLPGFTMLANDAKKAEIEIINISPDSAITAFPRVSLKEVIG